MFYEKLLASVLKANPNLKKLGKKCVFDLFKSNFINNNSVVSFPGYSISTLISNDLGPLVRINTKTKLIKNKTCLEEINGMNSPEDIREAFIGNSVIANYGNKNVHKIDDVVFDKNVSNVYMIFRKNKLEKEEMNLCQYFERNYKITIKDKNQPLFVKNVLKNQTLTHIFLVPELCLSTKIYDSNTKDDFGKNLSKTKLRPTDKMKQFEAFSEYLKFNGHGNKSNQQTPFSICEDWGFELSEEFVTVKARQLNPPELIYGKDKVVQINNGKFRSEQCLDPNIIEKWGYICEKNDNSVDNILDNMKKACHKLGLNLPKPKSFEYGQSRNWEERIKEDKNKLRELHILVIMLPNSFANTYKLVKKIIYSEIGIPCQCLVINKHRGGNLSSITNVLNQMVVKCNGNLYKLELGKFSEPLKFRSTIIGIEVSKHGNSIKYSCVCTTDRFHSKVFAEEYTKSPNDTNYYPLNAFLDRVITYFKSKSGKPNTFIIYRSGVNMYESKVVYEQEISPMKIFFEELSKRDNEFRPGYLFIMVNKLSDIKFFEKNNKDYSNPISGLCVDNSVTPGAYEFFIQPQFVNMGTATPTKFQVLFDNTSMSIEEIQEISYSLCYYYWNWAGAIRIPSVLKYSEVCNKFNRLCIDEKDSDVVIKDNIKFSPYFI